MKPARSALSIWMLVALLWVVAMLNYLDRQAIFSMFPPLQQEFKVTSSQLGLLSTFFLWVYGLASPLGGFLADRYSRKKIIIISLVIWSAITWLTGRAGSFNQLLVARALMGLSEACYIPAALALIADRHGDCTLMPMLCRIAPEQLRATGYGIFNLAGTLVGGTMAWAAGALKQAIGLGGALQISALILCAAGLVLSQLQLSAPTANFDTQR